MQSLGLLDMLYCKQIIGLASFYKNRRKMYGQKHENLDLQTEKKLYTDNDL